MNHHWDALIIMHGKVLKRSMSLHTLAQKGPLMETRSQRLKQGSLRQSKYLVSSNPSQKQQDQLKNLSWLFKSKVLTELLYGCESWQICNKLGTFQNRLRRILNIFWRNGIISLYNTELCQATSTNIINSGVKKRRWHWIGHVLVMEPSAGRSTLDPIRKKDKGKTRQLKKTSDQAESAGESWRSRRSTDSSSGFYVPTGAMRIEWVYWRDVMICPYQVLRLTTDMLRMSDKGQSISPCPLQKYDRCVENVWEPIYVFLFSIGQL